MLSKAFEKITEFWLAKTGKQSYMSTKVVIQARQDRVGVPEFFFRFHFSIFSLFVVSIEKIYQTMKTVFHHISKNLKVRQKYYSAACRFFNSLLGVWKCAQTRSFGFNILPKEAAK